MRRSVKFSVDASGKVDKTIPQYGGVRGEHNATEIVFTMSAAAPYKEGDLVRLRFTGGDGAVLSSDLVGAPIVQDGRILVDYTLPSVLTQAGGQLGVRVVFSRVDENGHEIETFITSEAVLYFDGAETENGTPFWTGVSEMLKRTTESVNSAVEARDTAIAAKEEAKTNSDKAEQFKDAAAERALEAVSSEKNAQLYASAALSHRDDAEAAASLASKKAQEIVAAGSRIEQLESDLDSTNAAVRQLTQTKLSRSGHEPNRYLGTDDKGRVVTKDVVGGGASVEDVKEAVTEYLENNPVKGIYVGEGAVPKGYNARINPKGRTIPFNPTPKTEAMTTPVGIDSEGRLWVETASAPVYEEWKGGAY